MLTTQSKPKSRLRAHIAAVVAATLALVGLTAVPASAEPIEPVFPTIFVSQVQGSNTILRVAEQDLDNPGQLITTAVDTFSGSYNSIGYRHQDGYIYGLQSNGNLIKISSDGAGGYDVESLGSTTVPSASGIGAGSFGDAGSAFGDVLFLKAVQSGNTYIRVDFSSFNGTNPSTLNITSSSFGPNVTLYDFTAAHGFLWGAQGGQGNKQIVRINPATNQVDVFAANSAFPVQANEGAQYGAAWTYGNGNLGFANNESGLFTQVRVIDPASASPGFELISTYQGDPASQNDGTSTPAFPVDLGVETEDPDPSTPGTPVTVTIEVTNNGNPGGTDGGSSGGVVRIEVPDGLDPEDLTIPDNCDVVDGRIICLLPPLWPPASEGGESSTTITITIPEAPDVSVDFPVEVIGNEEDPVPGNNTSTINVPVHQDVTSTGVGTMPQNPSQTVAVPAGGTITLLDEEGEPVDELVVSGGTYTVEDGELVFTPNPGVTGPQTPANFLVTGPGPNGGTKTGTYTPTVTQPGPPDAPPFESTGVGTTPQSPGTTVPVPPGGFIELLDGPGGDPAPGNSITVDGVGTYTLDPDTGVFTFVPVLGYHNEDDGEPQVPVYYRVTDAWGVTAANTYTPFVELPAGPTAPNFTSEGTGTETQSPAGSATIPDGGEIALVDGPVGATITDDEIVVPGVGTYTLDLGTGEFTFTPELGFDGPAPPVTYEVTDAYGQTATGTYTPHVHPPDGPSAPAFVSEGTGTEPQSPATSVTIPEDGSVVLLDGPGGDPVPGNSITTPGVGTYTLDPDTGVFTFVPEFGFHGPAPAVYYQVEDAYGQTASSTYTPLVHPPAPPVAEPFVSEGTGTTPQSPEETVSIPVGGSITLLDEDGEPVDEVTIPGVGTYTLDTTTGELRFVPVPGFHGEAPPVEYRITDAYGQIAVGTYTPFVHEPEPELLVNFILPVCRDDAPFLTYSVDVSEFFTPSSAQPLTITYLNPGGEDYVVENLPLEGELLWPGAEVDGDGRGIGWPGWERLADGTYVESAANFGWTTGSVEVLFEVNPEYSATLNYPAATADCLVAPAVLDSSTDDDALADTGSSPAPLAALAGVLLALGLGLVLVVRHRRDEGQLD